MDNVSNRIMEMKGKNPRVFLILQLILAVCIGLAVIWLMENLPDYIRFFVQKFSN